MNWILCGLLQLHIAEFIEALRRVLRKKIKTNFILRWSTIEENANRRKKYLVIF